VENQTGRVTTGTCLNCGNEYNGRYCALCGQSSKTGRLTVRTMLKGVLKGLIDFDQPLYRTLIGLTVRPGSMISEYVEGKRTGYTNPIKYCLSISALLIVLVRLRGSIVEVASRLMSTDPTAAEPAAEFLRQYNEINNVIQPYSHVISLAMMPVLAGFLYLVFRKSKRSFADQMAFGCFAVGHVAILNIAILALNLHHLVFDAVTVLINVGPPIYITWAAVVFNKNRVVPGVLRSLLAYGLFVGVTIVLMISVVFIRMAAL
jgi:Protein of unknown function (DUF3667)